MNEGDTNPKSTPSRPVLSALTSIDSAQRKRPGSLATVGCAILFYGTPIGIIISLCFMSTNHTASSFFEIVGTRQPSSVVIIHPDESSIWKNGSYLHFRISSNQFYSMVSTVGYQYKDRNTFNWKSPANPPAWWTPKKMGSVLSYYNFDFFEPDHIHPSATHWLVVNAAHTEVYAEAEP